MTYPYGVQIAVVRVDRDTGQVAVERYLIAYDIGRSINPMLVEGQLIGGAVQGLGGALSEEFRYDERGEPLSVTLADYENKGSFPNLVYLYLPCNHTSGTRPNKDGKFDGQLGAGGTFSTTFAEAGTYSYFCSIHSSMNATITVK